MVKPYTRIYTIQDRENDLFVNMPPDKDAHVRTLCGKTYVFTNNGDLIVWYDMAGMSEPTVRDIETLRAIYTGSRFTPVLLAYTNKISPLAAYIIDLIAKTPIDNHVHRIIIDANEFLDVVNGDGSGIIESLEHLVFRLLENARYFRSLKKLYRFEIIVDLDEKSYNRIPESVRDSAYRVSANEMHSQPNTPFCILCKSLRMFDSFRGQF